MAIIPNQIPQPVPTPGGVVGPQPNPPGGGARGGPRGTAALRGLGVTESDTKKQADVQVWATEIFQCPCYHCHAIC